MAYRVPTPADFLARFPEFGRVPATRIQPVIDDALLFVDTEVWSEQDYTAGILYWTAHVLFAEGVMAAYAGGSSGGGSSSGVGTSGDVSEVAVGDVRVRFGSGSYGTSSSSGAAKKLDSTSYGQLYLALLARQGGAIGSGGTRSLWFLRA